MNITKNALLNTNISKIKEVSIKSNSYLYIEFLNKRKGVWNMITLKLKESLKDLGIKTYADTLEYIKENYDKDLNLK